MQQLRDKLAVVERAAKAEAKPKEKYLLHFKVLEKRLKMSPNKTVRDVSQGINVSNGASSSTSLRESEIVSTLSSNEVLPRNFNLSRSSRLDSLNSSLKRVNSLSVTFTGDNRLINRNMVVPSIMEKINGSVYSEETQCNGSEDTTEKLNNENDDNIAWLLCDMLKEVLALQKTCHEKDQSLKDKDVAIEILAKKVEMLNKAIETEVKKMRRIVTSMEEEVVTLCNDKEQLQRSNRRIAIGGTTVGSAIHLMRSR